MQLKDKFRLKYVIIGDDKLNIQNITNDQQVYNLLKEGLDAASERSKVSANNIANINTKGYKREYVTFEENLKQSMDGLDLKKTDDKHMSLDNNSGDIEVKTDNSTSVKEDGNNVDIENEEVNQAANALMYNALISQASSRLAETKYVIEGK